MTVVEEVTPATPAPQTSTKEEDEMPVVVEEIGRSSNNNHQIFLDHLNEAPTANAVTTTTAEKEAQSSSPPTVAVTAEPIITTIVDVDDEEQNHPSDDFDDNLEKEEEDEETDDDKWCSCYNWMHFASVALFLLGSILYLVMAVDDYKWAHTLLRLPSRLRVSSSSLSPYEDDDLVWMQYRLEERYQEYLSTMTTTPAVGVRRRRMMTRKRRLLWEEEERMKDYATSSATTLEESSTTKSTMNPSMMLRELQQTPEELWYDLAWAELPEEIQAAWGVLGYNEVRQQHKRKKRSALLLLLCRRLCV